MKQWLLIPLCLMTLAGTGQKMGIGIHLGEPSGITAKFYGDDRIFECNLGRTHVYYGKNWYVNHFDDWYKKQEFPYKESKYLTYSPGFPVALQLHLLKQEKIREIAGKRVLQLDWYYGYGIQLAMQKYDYKYQYKETSMTPWTDKTTTVNDLDLGLDGVIGLEYRFPKAPFTAYSDIILFMEVFDNPFRFWFQGGVGLRYNFGLKTEPEVKK